MTAAEADACLRLDAALASAGARLALGPSRLERHARLTSRVLVLVDQVGALLAPRAGIPWPTRAEAGRVGGGLKERGHDMFSAALKARTRPLLLTTLRETPRSPPWLTVASYAHTVTVRRLIGSECFCGCSASFALLHAMAADPAGHKCDAVFELALRPAP